MQNKGIVIVTAVLLTLASIFYLSFSAATSYYDKQAAKLTDPVAQQDYKDSVKYLGIYSYQNCLETQIGLGLDLKGGMNVILEISVPDVVDMLADHKKDADFVKSMKEAKAEEETSQDDFISLFIKAFHKNAPNRHLAEIFATQQLPESELVTYDLINNAVLALDAGKVDAVSVAIPNGEMFAKSNPKLAVFEGQYFERGKNGNCIGLPKGETALRDRVNAIIAEVTEKGLYQQWLDEAVQEAKALGLDVN